MDTGIKFNGVFAPKPEGEQICDFCQEDGGTSRIFKDWDDVGIHIQLVHNEHGRTRAFYNGKEPDQEVLNHPDWTGFVD